MRGNRRGESPPSRGVRAACRRSHASTAARDPPSPPVTQIPSPASAPALPIGRSARPITVIVTTHASPAERSPPITRRADGLTRVGHTEHQLDDITLARLPGHHHGREEAERLGAIRREVGQRGGRRPPADLAQPDPVQSKVDVLHAGVGADARASRRPAGSTAQSSPSPRARVPSARSIARMRSNSVTDGWRRVESGRDPRWCRPRGGRGPRSSRWPHRDSRLRGASEAAAR